MCQKKMNPRLQERQGTRKISCAETERNLPTPSVDHSPVDEHRLHGCDDGTERRHRHKPDERTLHVTVQDGIETTRTRSIEMWLVAFGEIIPVRPRSSSWEITDDDGDKYTNWPRKAVRS
jgi:hypothetical protein